jgi:predicted transcriptional regulator of viral defense system
LAGPFTAAEASDIWGMNAARGRRLVAHFAAHGWLSRIRRDLYVTVPLEASAPSEWREDPWIVAARTFEPGYIGGWSACEHWGLTEQLFRDVVVVTARHVRDRHPTIQETTYRLKLVSDDELFGTEVVWRRDVRVRVSDPSRTLVDILDTPALGGGIRHVADVLATYFRGEHRDDSRLLAYIARAGNRTVYKRLGYLVEVLGIVADEITETCLHEQSTGFSPLDPTLPRRGPLLRRWNLQVNAHLDPRDADA